MFEYFYSFEYSVEPSESLVRLEDIEIAKLLWGLSNEENQ